MPLPMRRVEPMHVSRGTLPDRFKVQNDLEAVANGTLANVILQLSSLSHHAEELFGDLIRVGTEIATRANNLQARIDRLAVKVVQMDGNNEELGSMQEALNTKPFQSSMSFDQQVVSRGSMSAAMNKTYVACDKPPPLDNLNSYRDDGKDGLKFYTDPSYFFDLWRQEMLKDTEKVIKKPHKIKADGTGGTGGGGRHKKRTPRQPHNTRERFRHIAIEQGEHIMQGQEFNRPSLAANEIPDGVVYPPEQQNLSMQRHNSSAATARPSSIEIEKGYHPHPESPYGNGGVDINRGDYRLNSQNSFPNHLQNHMNHVPHHQLLNRTLSHTQYDTYDAYHNNQDNQGQRYYSPPPPYDQMSPNSSSSSVNIYSNPNVRFSGGIAATSTPRNGSMIISNGGGSPHQHNNSISSLSNGYGINNGFNRPSQPPPAPPPNFVGTPPGSHSGTPTRNTRVMSSRDTLPPPPPPPSDSDPQHHLINGSQNGNPNMPPPPPIMHDDDGEDPLPPPPPPPDSGMNMNCSRENLAPSPEHVPPPPPPPPMMMPDGFDKPKNISNGGLIKPKEKRVIPAPAYDGRSDLLKSIREGINLRKVETKKEPSVGKDDKAGGAGGTYCDVASILARRVAVEMSDSESGSDSEYDSDQWDETSA